MAATAARTRADFGRMIMILGAAAVLAFDLVALTRGYRGGGPGALRWLATAGVCVFYVLIIWCYLRRRPATATSDSVTAHAAAVTATLAPFAFPLLARAPGPGRLLAADVLLLTGITWSIWALNSLGRNLSVLAQARDLSDRGPYHWVRHPLYSGEIVSALGLAIAAGTVAAACLWVVLCALQVYRAIREEQVLVRALPGYSGYRQQTAALLPGVF